MPPCVLRVALHGATAGTVAAEWEVDTQLPLADPSQIARLKDALQIPGAQAGLPNHALYAVKGNQKEALDMMMSPIDIHETSGIELEALSLLLVPTDARADDAGAPTPTGTPGPAHDATDGSAPAFPRQDTSDSGHNDSTPRLDGREPSRRPAETYEAAQYGWVPIRRRTDAGAEFYVPACPAQDRKGGCTYSLCGKCVRGMNPVLKDVVWGDVTEHPAPVKPNTNYRAGWIGKLSFDRNKKGEWKVKSVGATWKDRYFKIGPNGLHYYSSEAFRSGKSSSSKAKNSKIFTTSTRLLENPSAAEFSILKDVKDEYKYFGLTFRDPHEALLMRVRRDEDKAEWVAFLGSTLGLLVQDEAWAKDAQPVLFKDLSSNYLARVSEYQVLEHDAREAHEQEHAETQAAERQVAVCKAETEHLNRLTDRAESDVTKTMEQVRVMLKKHQAMLGEAKRANAEALEVLARAELGAEASEKKLREAQLLHEQSWSKMVELKDTVTVLRAETEDFRAEKTKIFNKWRKQEERHQGKDAAAKREGGALLAFSPVDSPYNPRAVNLADKVASSTMLRSPSRKNLFMKATASPPHFPPPSL